MNDELDDAIGRYCSHFIEQIGRINAVSGESANLFKKILFCSVLDALSRSIYPRKEPRDRFTSIVRRFGKWAHQDRVSLPHLGRLLALTPDPEFENIRKFTFDKLEQWKAPWDKIKLDQDPIYNEVAKHWPKGEEYKKPMEKVRLESLTHLQLLYSHRNFLVHELRIPGYGIELMGDDEPFYHDLTTIADGGEPDLETIELVYPVNFFEKLCKIVLDELKVYFKENQLNPHDSYRYGSYWIEGLN
jgi:hypothetical protein